MPFQQPIEGDKVSIANKAPCLVDRVEQPMTFQTLSNASNVRASLMNEKKQLDIIVDYYSIDTLPESLKTWTFNLVKSNLYNMYVASNDGWSDADKQKEMRAPEARYLIARSTNDPNELHGFLLFQMVHEETMDDDIMAQVAYCYELQLIKESRNCGLGEYLMSLLQRIGHHWGMEKVMLTVFKANQGAFRFYTKKLGFELDEISPGRILLPSKARKFDYEILSKPCQ